MITDLLKTQYAIASPPPALNSEPSTHLYSMMKVRRHRKFSGIVFLHAFTAGVAGQSTQKNMRLFKQLCGNDQLVVVTTR
jgi:hypothetical protein